MNPRLPTQRCPILPGTVLLAACSGPPVNDLEDFVAGQPQAPAADEPAASTPPVPTPTPAPSTS